MKNLLSFNTKLGRFTLSSEFQTPTGNSSYDLTVFMLIDPKTRKSIAELDKLALDLNQVVTWNMHVYDVSHDIEQWM